MKTVDRRRGALIISANYLEDPMAYQEILKGTMVIGCEYNWDLDIVRLLLVGAMFAPLKEGQTTPLYQAFISKTNDNKTNVEWVKDENQNRYSWE